MSLMPEMWGNRRGCTWCAASVPTTWVTEAGMCSKAIPLPPASQMTAIRTMTMPGRTVPTRNPRLVKSVSAVVPRRVIQVANQYMAIEKHPTKIPFSASAGRPAM